MFLGVKFFKRQFEAIANEQDLPKTSKQTNKQTKHKKITIKFTEKNK